MTKIRLWLFRAASAAMGFAAAFHAAAVVWPSFRAAAYSPHYPLWRHATFIVVDAVLAVLLVVRPRWLVWLFGLLTLQIYYGHGRSAWILWAHEGRIGWIDLVSVVGGSLILVLVASNRRTETLPSSTNAANV